MMARSPSLKADLVLEGGGVLGIGHVGAISVLENAGYSFPRVAGTSAGSIVGALVAAGMPTSRITDIMTTLDYRRFADRSLLDRVPVGGPLLSLLMDDGIFEGDHLREWLGNLLVDECGVETFGDLAIDDPGSSLPPERRFRLVVTATDVTRGELVYFPWDYERTYGLEPGRQRVVDAVRASMSIPFFYEPVTLAGAGQTPSTLVDGGVLANFPIDIFDRTDNKPSRWPTFGIKLSAHADAAQHVVNKVHSTLSMTQAMVATMTGFYDRIHIDNPGTQARTIFVDTMKVHATDFDIDAKTQQKLYDNGRRAATLFLDGGNGFPPWNWEQYLSTYDAGRVTPAM